METEQVVKEVSPAPPPKPLNSEHGKLEIRIGWRWSAKRRANKFLERIDILEENENYEEEFELMQS